MNGESIGNSQGPSLSACIVRSFARSSSCRLMVVAVQSVPPRVPVLSASMSKRICSQGKSTPVSSADGGPEFHGRESLVCRTARDDSTTPRRGTAERWECVRNGTRKRTRVLSCGCLHLLYDDWCVPSPKRFFFLLSAQFGPSRQEIFHSVRSHWRGELPFTILTRRMHRVATASAGPMMHHAVP